MLWGSHTTPRCKLFAWRVFNFALPTKLSLRRRGFYLDDGCSLCFSEIESNLNVLRDCKMACDVWSLIPLGKLVMGPSLSDPVRWFLYVAWVLNEKDWNWFLFCIWELWNLRNAIIQGGKG